MIEHPLGDRRKSFPAGWCSVGGANCNHANRNCGEPVPRISGTTAPAIAFQQHHLWSLSSDSTGDKTLSLGSNSDSR
jgi:hypothetical protein